MLREILCCCTAKLRKITGPAEIMIRRWKSEAREIFQEKKERESWEDKMIAASNVTYRVGKKALFEDVNIKFTEGNCYGVIGANGAGKSTFLKILSGALEPGSGEIIVTPGQRLSVLEQDQFKYDAYPCLLYTSDAADD